MKKVTALILLTLLSLVDGQSDIVYPAGKCASNSQFLRITSLSCVACTTFDPNYEFYSTAYSLSSTDYYSPDFTCRCKYGYRSAWDSDKLKYTCLACPAGTNSSLDRTFCLACGDSSALSSKGICSCSDPSSVLIDRDGSGVPLNATRCVLCDSKSYPSPDKQRCISCPDARMKANVLPNNSSFSCDCPDDSVVRDQGTRCVLKGNLQTLSQAYPSPQAITYYVCKTCLFSHPRIYLFPIECHYQYNTQCPSSNVSKLGFL